MITDYVFSRLLDTSIEKAKKILKESNSRLLITKRDLEDAINYHLKAVENWSAEISFNDLKKAKLTSRVFIDLDVFVYPRRVRIEVDEKIEKIPLRSLLETESRHMVLLGQPGAGKTTSMKYLCQSLLHDECFPNLNFSFPILIKFRELNNPEPLNQSKSMDNPDEFSSGPIFDLLYNIFALSIDLPDELKVKKKKKDRGFLKEKLVMSIIEQLNVLLILEGFDELVQINHRNESLREIRKLTTFLENSTAIVTSRSADFHYNIGNASIYEICSLNHEQIRNFSLKWLDDENKASGFVNEINNSPFLDTTIRPLNLAHLCAIYERIGKIPDKPKTLYRKIVNLLLEEWDEQRSVKRYSRYANFEVDRKFDFLCNLAYELTTSLKKTVFSDVDLKKVYDKTYIVTQIFNTEGFAGDKITVYLVMGSSVFKNTGDMITPYFR
ncbi:NACHT domain-containing protein [Acidobacteriota bacterium]